MANSSFRRPLFNHAADQYDDQRAGDPRGQQQDSDPLAELARLIGQTDPLSPYARGAQQPAHATHVPVDRFADDHPVAPEADDPAHQPPSWMQNAQNWRQGAHQESAHDPHYEPQASVDDDRFYANERAYARDERAAAAYSQGADPRYDEALYGRSPQQHAEYAPQQDSGPPYAYPGHEQGYDEEYPAEEEPPRRRGGGLLTVGIVAALAVVGTAGAFAYRSYSGGTRGGEPPVIKADASPTKVVPAAPSKDPSGKVITDRIGPNGPAGERVVSREEAPVDVKGAGPRVVFPPLSQQPAPPATTAATAPPMAGGGGMSDEPKRIKTVSVRPDGASAVAPQAKTAPAPQPARPASAAPAANNAPISLTPQRSTPDPRPVAALPQPPAEPAATAGGYVVQVSSQKSEADASASYRALQSKFPSVLGSRQPIIKRADLSAQGMGVVYRAVVGPFASQEAASQVCGNLKNAGGQCVVQRN